MTTDLVQDFLDEKLLDGLQRSTVKRYGEVLRRLERDLGRPAIDISTTQLRRYVAAWKDDHSDNGAAFVLRHLKAFYTWAETEELLAESPAASLQLATVAEPMLTASSDDIDKLLALKGRDRTTLRDRAVLHLLVSTGARRSEIGLLTTDDLLLADRLVRIRQSKTIARHVPTTDECSMHVARWVRCRDGKPGNLWSSKDGPALVGRIVARRSCGDLSPHSIRRWFATEWLSSGGSETSLARLLGWSSTTMVAVYTRATAQQVTETEYRRVFTRR